MFSSPFLIGNLSAVLEIRIRVIIKISVHIDEKRYNFVKSDAYGTFTVSSVRYKGLSAGLNATSDTVIRNVRICGPKNVIAKLKDNMFYAMVDLSDKAAGEHTVSAVIRSDSYNNVWQVGSYSAMVKIR